MHENGKTGRAVLSKEFEIKKINPGEFQRGDHMENNKSSENIDLKEVDAKIRQIKTAAEELKQLGESFPALSRNAVRILASAKMLEINSSDVNMLK